MFLYLDTTNILQAGVVFKALASEVFFGTWTLGVGVCILTWNFYSHFVHFVALNSVNWEEKLGVGVGDRLADTP